MSSMMTNHNRYELLFMDDHEIAHPSRNLVLEKKKQEKNVVATTVSNANHATSSIIHIKGVTASALQQALPTFNNKLKNNQQKPSTNTNKNEGGGRQKKPLQMVQGNGILRHQALVNNSNNHDSLQQQPRANAVKQQQQQQNVNNRGHQIRRYNLSDRVVPNTNNNNQNENSHQMAQSINGSGNVQNVVNRPFVKQGNGGKARSNFEGGNNYRDRHSGSNKTGKKQKTL